MPDISFKDADYAGLPAELLGKSPTEIAAYYQAQAAAASPNPNPNPTPSDPAAPPTSSEFFANPAAAVARVSPTRAELESSNQTLIEAAELVAKNKHSDWDKFSAEIRTIMKDVSVEQQRSSGMWDTAYYQVKGLNADKIRDDAVAAVRATSAAESPTAPSGAAPTEEGLHFPQGMESKGQTMLEGLDVSSKSYLAAQERIEKGSWPLTMSNVRRR